MRGGAKTKERRAKAKAKAKAKKQQLELAKVEQKFVDENLLRDGESFKEISQIQAGECLGDYLVIPPENPRLVYGYEGTGSEKRFALAMTFRARREYFPGGLRLPKPLVQMAFWMKSAGDFVANYRSVFNALLGTGITVCSLCLEDIPKPEGSGLPPMYMCSHPSLCQACIREYLRPGGEPNVLTLCPVCRAAPLDAASRAICEENLAFSSRMAEMSAEYRRNLHKQLELRVIDAFEARYEVRLDPRGMGSTFDLQLSKSSPDRIDALVLNAPLAVDMARTLERTGEQTESLVIRLGPEEFAVVIEINPIGLLHFCTNEGHMEKFLQGYPLIMPTGQFSQDR